MMRSDFADPKEKTYVELVFTNRGKTYTVTRNPEYLRPKTRGEGMTRESADASLVYSDGRVVSGSRPTTKAVEELLGIDRNQFVQIAMIAQGDFLKLLLAGTEERGRIFRKIFDTGGYLDFQKELKRRKLETERQYQELKRSVVQYAEGILLPEKTELSGAVLQEDGTQKEHAAYVAADRLAGLLKEDVSYHLCEVTESLQLLLKEEHLLQKEGQKTLASIEKKLLTLQEQYGIQQMAQKARTETEKKKKLLEEICAEETLCREQLALSQKKQPLAEEAAGKAAVLQQKMVQFEELARLAAVTEALQKRLEDGRGQTAHLETEAAGIVEAIRLSEVRLEEIQNPEQELIRLEAQEERCRALRQELQSFEGHSQETDILWENVQKQEVQFAEARAVSTKLGREYVDMESAFLGAQAGILAELLEDGSPCPVCGSREHPVPARKSAQVPSEHELKKLGERKEQALAKTTKLAENLAAKRAQYNGSVQQMLEWMQRNVNLPKMAYAIEIQEKELQKSRICVEEKDDNANTDFAKEGLAEVQDIVKRLTENREYRSRFVQQIFFNGRSRLQERESAQKQKRKSLEGLIREKQQITQNLPKLQKQKEEVQQKREQTAKLMVQVQTELAAAKEQAEKLKKELPYPDRESAQQALNGLIRERNQIEREIEQARNGLEVCVRRKAAEENALKALQKQASGKGSAQELEEMRLEGAQLTARKKELEKEQKQRHALLETDERICAKLLTSQEKLGEAEENYEILAELSDTANGELKGRAKIAFEQYIQIVFFSQIIHEANKRFSVMTDGRYLLKRREEAGNLRSQTGLELNVFDYYTGKLRSVQSLSGGESFKASLSMALGLADVVQQYAGGVQLDTVFIDEGFGSLDRESLNQAIRILHELAGTRRLAGIISHVDELKERIDKKIVVTKGSSGSNLTLIRG